jgi:hypothetical protein
VGYEVGSDECGELTRQGKRGKNVGIEIGRKVRNANRRWRRHVSS